MKKQYAISLFVASLLIVTLAAVAGSGRNGGDLPAPPAIGAKIADRFGANHTPEAYVIDASGKLVYHGRIDNSQNTANITSNDLRDALDALLAGKPIQKTTSVAFGCSIKRVS